MSSNANHKNSPKFVPWSKLFIVWVSSFYLSEKSLYTLANVSWNLDIYSVLQVRFEGFILPDQQYTSIMEPNPNQMKAVYLLAYPPKKIYKANCRYSYIIPSYSQLVSPPVAFFARLAAGSATTLSSLGTK